MWRQELMQKARGCCSLTYSFSLQVCIRVTTKKHMVESVLGCLEIISVNVINPTLFTLLSGIFFQTKAENSHILCQNITRTFSRPYTNNLLLWNLLNEAVIITLILRLPFSKILLAWNIKFQLQCLTPFLIQMFKVHIMTQAAQSGLSHQYPMLK